MTAAKAETIEIAVLENAALGVVALEVLRQAYAKIGVTVTTRSFPLRRGVQMANAGEVDGDLMHTAASLKEWDRLVIVKVPVAKAVFAAYRRDEQCPPRIDATELGSKRIAYMRGTRAVEDALPAQSLVEATNNLDALRYVQRGMVDLAVIGQMESDTLLIKHGMKEICKVSEPVVTSELFHSLHLRHQGLAVRVERVLQEMTDQGEVKRIWTAEAQRARKALLARHPALNHTRLQRLGWASKALGSSKAATRPGETAVPPSHARRSSARMARGTCRYSTRSWASSFG